MGDVCGGTPAPKYIRRNGIDNDPNADSGIEWQMSPFSNERFDLNDRQIAEKAGRKAKREPPKPEPKKSECKICAEKRAAKLRGKNCTSAYLYQPYGPNTFSSMSYSTPESPLPRMYTYLGPSHYAGFIFKTPQPGKISPIPCQDIELAKRKRNFNDVYIPYGPLGELRITPDMYVPMGPSAFPLL